MANPTVQQQITALEAELTFIKTQMASVSSGAQSFSLGDLSATLPSYDSLRSRRIEIEKSLQRLYRGGRGLQVDLSYNDFASAEPDRTLGDTTYVRNN